MQKFRIKIALYIFIIALILFFLIGSIVKGITGYSVSGLSFVNLNLGFIWVIAVIGLILLILTEKKVEWPHGERSKIEEAVNKEFQKLKEKGIKVCKTYCDLPADPSKGRVETWHMRSRSGERAPDTWAYALYTESGPVPKIKKNLFGFKKEVMETETHELGTLNFRYNFNNGHHFLDVTNVSDIKNLEAMKEITADIKKYTGQKEKVDLIYSTKASNKYKVKI